MPELPEVEVTRRGFADTIFGATIVAVHMGKPLRWPLGIAPGQLAGRRVGHVRRRGKYLLVDLDEGLLLIHLGMSGSLRFGTGLPPRGMHDHFEMETSQGTLRLHDPRRFGAVVWAANEQAPEVRARLSGLGMEPLSADFDFAAFYAGLRVSRQAVKQWLLAGKVVVGVGNIYASEVLFLAGILPTTCANAIGVQRAKRLHAAIQEVLAQAIERGGSSLRDFSGADGSAGHFQLETKVYGREGLPCHKCSTPVRLLRQGQRSSYYCPRCQKT